MRVDGQLAADINTYGPGDTLLRSQLANAVSRTLLGRDWPTFGDRPTQTQEDAFYRELAAAASEQDWLA